MQSIEKPVNMQDMYKMLNVCENTFRYTILNPLLKIQEKNNIDIGIIPRKTPKRIKYMFQPQKFVEAIKLLTKSDTEDLCRTNQLKCQKVNLKPEAVKHGMQIYSSKAKDIDFQLENLISMKR